MFRSIFCEGLARPLAGIRLILKKLVRKFKELGGELRLRAGVIRIRASDGRARELVLDDGSVARRRTRALQRRLAGDDATVRRREPGRRQRRPASLSFIESVSALERAAARVGLRHTIVFFNDSDSSTGKSPTNWPTCAAA